MNHRRIRGEFRRWTGLAVARDRAKDQPWVDVAERRVVQLQAPHHAGPKILHQNIRAHDQPTHGLHPLRRFQVEHQALLADIELTEHRAAAVAHRRADSHRLALGGFDLDDLGAHIGQHPRAVRAGDRGRKIEDAQALEAPCQIPLIRFRLSSFARCPSSYPRWKQVPCDGPWREHSVSRFGRKAFPPAMPAPSSAPLHRTNGPFLAYHFGQSWMRASLEGSLCDRGDGRLRPRRRTGRRFRRPAPGADRQNRCPRHAAGLSRRRRTAQPYRDCRPLRGPGGDAGLHARTRRDPGRAAGLCAALPAAL